MMIFLSFLFFAGVASLIFRQIYNDRRPPVWVIVNRPVIGLDRTRFLLLSAVFILLTLLIGLSLSAALAALLRVAGAVFLAWRAALELK